MLHSLEADVDREEFPTRFGGEFLNVSVLVVTDTPLDYVLRTTVDTSVEHDWFDNSWSGLFSNGEFDLNRPDMLANYVSIFEVWACAKPPTLSYTELMEKYLDKITPQVSDTWRADELFLKVKGNMKYLYALMDDQTRFWIAQEVADTKFTADLRPLFQKGKEIAEKNPRTLITDGAPNFHEAYENEFRTAKIANRTEHIREIAFNGVRHNNKMERMNGELRQREKVMRTLEKTDIAILSGMQIYHNYVRPHEALDGRTPSEAAGIRVEGENKWLTLIQNARPETVKS
jgi:transposase-like protein